jgi:hypothetical protein
MRPETKDMDAWTRRLDASRAGVVYDRTSNPRTTVAIYRPLAEDLPPPAAAPFQRPQLCLIYHIRISNTLKRVGRDLCASRILDLVAA